MKYVILLALTMLSIPVLADQAADASRTPSSATGTMPSTEQATAPVANMDSDAILREIQKTMEKVDVSADSSDP